MTLPYERTRAVTSTEEFLYDLLDPQKTPRIPKAIRQRAHHLLRHYPTSYDMKVICDREDSSTDPMHHHIFSKVY
jgi:hypothetical protein